MIYVVYALAAVLGTAVHLWRHPADRVAGRAVEVALIWWIVVTIGIAGIVGAGFHFFDGAEIAREIGFTRGDGGFQTEVGFGDLALGVAAVLTIWFRDWFLLAVVVIAAISLWGDAYGHIHQAAVNDNHDPDNTGPVLYADLLFPSSPPSSTQFASAAPRAGRGRRGQPGRIAGDNRRSDARDPSGARGPATPSRQEL